MALFGSGRSRCRESGLSLPTLTWQLSDLDTGGNFYLDW